MNCDYRETSIFKERMERSMYETLKYEIKDNIGYITISRPEALNAISTTVLTELKAVLQQVENDPEVKVVILTGEGKAFVAGADIAQMSALSGVEDVYKRQVLVPTFESGGFFRKTLGDMCELPWSSIVIIGDDSCMHPRSPSWIC